jgi:hypothetical protein
MRRVDEQRISNIEQGIMNFEGKNDFLRDSTFLVRYSIFVHDFGWPPSAPVRRKNAEGALEDCAPAKNEEDQEKIVCQLAAKRDSTWPLEVAELPTPSRATGWSLPGIVG